MRKLKIIEHTSLDGVIQNSDEDGDFPYGDWTAAYRTPNRLHRATIAQAKKSYHAKGRLSAPGVGRSDYEPLRPFSTKSPSRDELSIYQR